MEIRDIIAMLNTRWDSLVMELFPNAVRKAGWFELGSLAGERGQSLKLYRGVRAGAWVDYGGSDDDKGDALILIEKVVTGGNRGEAVKWAKGWLGIDDIEPAELRRRQQNAQAAVKHQDYVAQQDAVKRRDKAHKMWLSAEPKLRDTPVDYYLRGRGVDLREWPRQPGALRFHPDAYERESRSGLPAMMACITGERGFMAAHRTYLTQSQDETQPNEWFKAPLANCKKVYGTYAGGSIPIWRGASRCPLKDSPPGERIALTEGIEDALTMALVDPTLRVHAAVSLSNLAAVWLPDTVKEVILCRQNDWDNPQAIAAFEKAIKAHAAKGRVVIDFQTPESAGKDPNDWLQSTNYQEAPHDPV